MTPRHAVGQEVRRPEKGRPFGARRLKQQSQDRAKKDHDGNLHDAEHDHAANRSNEGFVSQGLRVIAESSEFAVHAGFSEQSAPCDTGEAGLYGCNDGQDESQGEEREERREQQPRGDLKPA